MKKIVYDYVNAVYTQTVYEAAFDVALSSLGSETSITQLGKAVQDGYTELVKSMLTPEQWDWVEYWMWECDFGNSSLNFTINGVVYNITETTLLKYLDVVL